MFRIIRRAPWIAAGAAAAYFMDSANGPARRHDLADRARSGADQLMQQWRGIATGADTSADGPGGARDDAPLADAPLAPSMAADTVAPVDPSTPVRSGARGAA